MEKGPRARKIEGFADFGEPVRDDDDEYQVDEEEEIAEGDDMPQLVGRCWQISGTQWN